MWFDVSRRNRLSCTWMVHAQKCKDDSYFTKSCIFGFWSNSIFQEILRCFMSEKDDAQLSNWSTCFDTAWLYFPWKIRKQTPFLRVWCRVFTVPPIALHLSLLPLPFDNSCHVAGRGLGKIDVIYCSIPRRNKNHFSGNWVDKRK